MLFRETGFGFALFGNLQDHVSADDLVRAHEEEGGGDEQRADDDVWLDGRLLIAVAEQAPDGRGDRVGAVLQPEQEAHVEGREVELSKNLKNALRFEVSVFKLNEKVKK